MIRPQDRGLQTVRIAVKVGELLDGLWPPSPGRGRRRVAANWRKLLPELYRSRDWTVPDATGGRWFPMALRRLPANADGTPAVDDTVVIDLAPPPGAASGGTADLPALDKMGVSSGPQWYAYLAGRSLVWMPGTTRRPVPRVPRQYGWSRDPNDYPVPTLADLQRFAFGGRDEKHRTKCEILAPWETLPDLVIVSNQIDDRTGVQGYRLLPTEAEHALARLRRGAGE